MTVDDYLHKGKAVVTKEEGREGRREGGREGGRIYLPLRNLSLNAFS